MTPADDASHDGVCSRLHDGDALSAADYRVEGADTSGDASALAQSASPTNPQPTEGQNSSRFLEAGKLLRLPVGGARVALRATPAAASEMGATALKLTEHAPQIAERVVLRLAPALELSGGSALTGGSAYVVGGSLLATMASLPVLLSSIMQPEKEYVSPSSPAGRAWAAAEAARSVRDAHDAEYQGVTLRHPMPGPQRAPNPPGVLPTRTSQSGEPPRSSDDDLLKVASKDGGKKPDDVSNADKKTGESKKSRKGQPAEPSNAERRAKEALDNKRDEITGLERELGQLERSRAGQRSERAQSLRGRISQAYGDLVGLELRYAVARAGAQGLSGPQQLDVIRATLNRTPRQFRVQAESQANLLRHSVRTNTGMAAEDRAAGETRLSRPQSELAELEARVRVADEQLAGRTNAQTRATITANRDANVARIGQLRGQGVTLPTDRVDPVWGAVTTSESPSASSIFDPDEQAGAAPLRRLRPPTPEQQRDQKPINEMSDGELVILQSTLQGQLEQSRQYADSRRGTPEHREAVSDVRRWSRALNDVTILIGQRNRARERGQ